MNNDRWKLIPVDRKPFGDAMMPKNCAAKNMKNKISLLVK